VSDAGHISRARPGQVAAAARFRELHTGAVLVLPNAWDAASAALIEAAGARAIASTSAGVSWALGTHDRQGLDRRQMAGAVARIVQSVRVPVTADIERGYGREPSDVAETVKAIIDAGAVGINLEDSPGSDGQPLESASAQAGRIAAARDAAEASGIDLFINARTDVYLRRVGEPASRVQNVKQRQRIYADAGADGLFVPGLIDLDIIRELALGSLPLNLLAGPGAPSIAELGRAGASRISVGPAIAQAAYQLVSRSAAELLTTGTYQCLVDAMDYDALDTLMSKRARDEATAL
jgi:2-methylisocitrate lyase-like PEP mutase family enzyme